jgi:hypothetical protein
MVKKSPHFMEPESSSARSQNTLFVTDLSQINPAQSLSHHPIIFKTYFNIILPSTPVFSKVVLVKYIINSGYCGHKSMDNINILTCSIVGTACAVKCTQTFYRKKFEGRRSLWNRTHSWGDARCGLNLSDLGMVLKELKVLVFVVWKPWNFLVSCIIL